MNLFKYNNMDIKLSPSISFENIDCIELEWNQPYRFYHSTKHLVFILKSIETLSLNDEDRLILILAAYYHDAIYKPWSKSNEEDSIKLFLKHFKGKDRIKNKVVSIIECTKHRIEPSRKQILEHTFWNIDNSIIYNSSFEQMLEWENEIFKEYQFVDYTQYKSGRIEFLKSITNLNPEQKNKIESLIKFVENRKPKIGLYAGSFNPFSIGHLGVVEEAEKIFDKVIIAQGMNPDKKSIDYKLPFDWRQKEVFTGLLTNLIKEKEKDCEITLIRGLRNGKDFEYEMEQISHMNMLKPDLKAIFIPCNKNTSHISSSAIRSLYKIGEKESIDLANNYIYKGIEN